MTRRALRRLLWILAGVAVLYAFLTTEPNAVVKPIHPKAMPVILTQPEECREWMEGGTESLRLQRPLGDEGLRLVEE